MKPYVKRTILIAGLAAIPAFWNACGKVAFESGSANYKSCAATGADLSNCFHVGDVTYKDMSQSVAVTANANVDILFIVDNSGSMAEEQIGIGNKINGFLDKIKNLNWQIAVTTTDDRANSVGPDGVARAWGDGQFRPFDSDTGSQFILRSTQVNAIDAQTKLAAAIQMGVQGNGDERGINSTYRAIERAASPSINKDFLRADSKLAVVLISDEDECSTGANGCNGGSASRSVPQNVVNLINNQYGGTKGFSFNSIIYIPGDASCTTGANAGNTYKQLSTLTNGVLASVCSADFTTPLANIGSRVVNLVNSVTLTCKPEDINNDGKAELQIKLADGTNVTSGFTVSGKQVDFSSPLPEGTHSFFYFCK